MFGTALPIVTLRVLPKNPLITQFDLGRTSGGEHLGGADGYRRVEWKCDALNRRSRRTAERLASASRAFRTAHYIVKGRNRDTAWFRTLQDE
jgi:hypothetical protein